MAGHGESPSYRTVQHWQLAFDGQFIADTSIEKEVERWRVLQALVAERPKFLAVVEAAKAYRRATAYNMLSAELADSLDAALEALNE